MDPPPLEVAVERREGMSGLDRNLYNDAPQGRQILGLDGEMMHLERSAYSPILIQQIPDAVETNR